MDLKDLYRDVILDHNKNPRNFGKLEPCDTSADGHNPLCGDRLTLTLRLEGDTVSDIRFEGKGCAISTASASLMTEAIKGLDERAITALSDVVHRTLTSSTDAAVPEGLGKLAALSGVREYPARVKCASLCWHTLAAALAHRGGQFALNQAHQGLAWRERAHHLLAQGFVFDAGNELAHHGQRHIGFKQGHAHLAQHVRDVGLGDAGLPTEVLDQFGKLVGKCGGHGDSLQSGWMKDPRGRNKAQRRLWAKR